MSKKTIQEKQVISALSKSIDKRFILKPRRKLIIHNDRGTQFSSILYKKFTEDYFKFFTSSMSRENTPTDNAVGEKFMRTFKEHKIHSITIEEKLQANSLNNSNFSSFRSVISQYRKLSYMREFNSGLITDYLRHSKFDSLDETKSFFLFLQFLSFLQKWKVEGLV